MLIITPIPLPFVFDKHIKLQTLLITCEPSFSSPIFYRYQTSGSQLPLMLKAQSSANPAGARLPGEGVWGLSGQGRLSCTGAGGAVGGSCVCSLQDPAGSSGGPAAGPELLRCPLGGCSLRVLPGAAGAGQPGPEGGPQGCQPHLQPQPQQGLPG